MPTFEIKLQANGPPYVLIEGMILVAGPRAPHHVTVLSLDELLTLYGQVASAVDDLRNAVARYVEEP